jgi:hypothetical protein
MENKDFAVFILTHGRPDKIKTLKSLELGGYTGKIYFIIDNEDKTIDEHIRKFGREYVKVFDKKHWADQIDECDNFDERRTTTHARNASFSIAEEIGIKYFIQLDDDYTDFRYRWVDNKYITDLTKIIPKSGKVKNLDRFFDIHLDFYKKTNFKSIAFAQGGDFIGGEGCGLISNYRRNSRKCMNSFICSTDRPFQFLGSMNEDVNAYVLLGSRGDLFLTLPFIGLEQAPTQITAGAITDKYKKYGTYCKSFMTVMIHPSSVKVSMMGNTVNRLHHRVKWINTTPMIISEKHKKQ